MVADTMAHFALGMVITVFMVTMVWPEPRYPRTLGVLGGIWATIPSVMNSFPRTGDVLLALPVRPPTEVFFAHGVIQRLVVPVSPERTRVHRLTALLIATTVVVIAWAETRRYRSPFGASRPDE